MSTYAITQAWELTGVSCPEKCVCVALADTATEDQGETYPSLTRLAQKTSLHRVTVSRVIKSLVKKGLILKTGKSRYDTTLYVLPWGIYTPPAPSSRPGSAAPSPVHLSGSAPQPDSSGALPDWQRSATTLVAESYPNQEEEFLYIFAGPKGTAPREFRAWCDRYRKLTSLAVGAGSRLEEGYRTFLASIRTTDDLAAFWGALDRYERHLSANTWKNRLNPLTWLKCWRDRSDEWTEVAERPTGDRKASNGGTGGKPLPQPDMSDSMGVHWTTGAWQPMEHVCRMCEKPVSCTRPECDLPVGLATMCDPCHALLLVRT